jgi:hypothetical protein
LTTFTPEFTVIVKIYAFWRTSFRLILLKDAIVLLAAVMRYLSDIGQWARRASTPDPEFSEFPNGALAICRPPNKPDSCCHPVVQILAFSRMAAVVYARSGEAVGPHVLKSEPVR